MSILSIQSHVAYGHVGNAAAAFALQRLGLEVWPVMTVQLSNHTGYGSWRGRSFEAEHIAELAQGLEEVGALAACRAVLSGYLRTAAVGEAVLGALDRAQRCNPDALFVCDPVLGDHGRGLYVPEEVVAFFRDRAVPRARIVTPNLFELAQLTGRAIDSRAAALAAARDLRALGPEAVLVTSVRFPESEPETIALLAVTGAGAWQIATPWLDMDPPINGAGDTVAALFLGHYLLAGDGPDRVSEAAARAASAIFAVIEATRAAGGRELQLIAAQDKLVAPHRHFAAERID
ncbi:MAG: pyridoxal kinase PdxY [Kiloniellales bacterium]|nr:pyridoxal kinase PdxY [Kiloniellales bacterium]